MEHRHPTLHTHPKPWPAMPASRPLASKHQSLESREGIKTMWEINRKAGMGLVAVEKQGGGVLSAVVMHQGET